MTGLLSSGFGPNAASATPWSRARAASQPGIGTALKAVGDLVPTQSVGADLKELRPLLKRLHSLTGLDTAVVAAAEARLAYWSLSLKQRGLSLPHTLIFTNEPNVIEFEWELDGRFLWLVCRPGDPIESFRQEGNQDAIEAAVSEAAVVNELRWLLGR